MELNFSEINNNLQNDRLPIENNTSPIEYDKYWEQPKPLKKKKVSFDDILTNMNLVVNQHGALQFMTPIKKNIDINGPLIVKKQDPVEPVVKHSYIYNKYFKDYRDANAIPERPPVRVAKTKEEYNKMILEERMKLFYQKKRIQEIKSKKLMFTHSLDNSNNSNNAIMPTKNKLRSMNFH
jgi:hypothetical protein